MLDKNKIITMAKKYVDKPDKIIDLYDFSIVYASPKLCQYLGYSEEDLEKIPAYDIFADAEKMKNEVIGEGLFNEHGFKEINIRTKMGDVVQSKMEFYTIQEDGGFFQIGKMLDN